MTRLGAWARHDSKCCPQCDALAVAHQHRRERTSAMVGRVLIAVTIVVALFGAAWFVLDMFGAVR